MWNQINILIYLSLIAIEFYFAEMSIVIIRKNYFDTIRLLGPIIYPTASLIVKIKLFVKKNLSLPPLNVLNNQLHNYSI